MLFRSRPPSRYTLNRFSPQLVSEALCLRAKSVYEDQRAVSSPFQQRAMEEGIHFAGGKRDDITTLIGVVGELEASPVSPRLCVCARVGTDDVRPRRIGDEGRVSYRFARNVVL